MARFAHEPSYINLPLNHVGEGHVAREVAYFQKVHGVSMTIYGRAAIVEDLIARNLICCRAVADELLRGEPNAPLEFLRLLAKPPSPSR